VNLLLRDPQPQWRVDFIARHLTTPWTISFRGENRDQYADAMAQADALVAISFRSSDPPAPRLQLLQLPGAGFERIAFDALPEACTVCNVFEHEIPIAEYLVLAMLEWQIRTARMSAGLRQGIWNDGMSVGEPIHGELFGKTVGFIGYGHIGSQTALRLRPFGVRMVACTRTPSRYDPVADGCLDYIAGLDKLDALLAESDFVVVGCPLTEATRGLIDARRLGLMRSNAVLLNVARAEVVDQAALFAACKSRRIAGAVIDVWTQYPRPGSDKSTITYPSEHPFHDLDNVVMTPHSSGWTDGLWDRRWKTICSNLDRLSNGEPLNNVLKAPGGAAPT
jgi:phosphoglycerate dehydrogenase-like enzyme